MKRKAGRPKGKNNRQAMTFRFRREFAELIRKLADRSKVPQVRIIEIALTLHSKEINLA